jgi:riboflavin biosynthesis pyrimidine reductase
VPLLAAVDDLDTLYDDLVLGGSDPRTTPWLALCMVTSLDGSVTLRGVSGGLGGPADHRALGRIRDACDVILVGAGTVRDEDYPPYPGGAARQARRTAKGLAPRPPVAMVTRTGSLPDGHPLVADPDDPPIVIVARAHEPAVRAALAHTPAGPAIRWIVAGEPELDWRSALDGLAALGLPRISCEGGPRINGELLDAGLVDEAFVTVAPALVGGAGLRLTRTDTPARRYDLTLVSALTHGSELLLRYRRADPSGVPSADAASR